MDPRENQDLIERLKSKQAQIEEMQRKMAEQVGSVKKAIVVEEVMLRRIMGMNPPLDGQRAD